MSFQAIGKFIGPDEIVATTVLEHVTPSGKAIIEVEFKTGKTRLYPEPILELIMTDEVSDCNSVSEKKLTPALQRVMEVLTEHNIEYGEIELFTKQLVTNLDNNFNRALSYLWYGNDKEFTVNAEPMWYVSVIMADRILQGINKNGK